MIRRSLTLVLALALSACGFHLRNALVLPDDLGPIQVKSIDRYSPLADALTQSIERTGAQIAQGTATDATVLDLLSERWGDTPIAVDQLGRAQEFALRYAVVFELRKPDGTTPVPRQTIELSRDYISNPVNAIGTDGEREILIREMRREMAASILRRLGAVARAGGAMPMPGTRLPESRLDEPVAEDAAKAALEAADANPPPPPEQQPAPVPPQPPLQ